MDFYLKKASPLIVCGRPRAGTRFITNVLNSFPEVTLQGEIPDPVMRSLEMFIEDVDGYYRKRFETKPDVGEKQYGLWKDKKKAVFFSFWAGVSQAGRAQPGSACRFYGYKRPEHERFFDFYERHLVNDPPVYVYCVRNFVDNYLSIKSRWPARKIERVADAYLTSIKWFLEQRKKHPARILLFNLDDHIKHGFHYTESSVLQPLGLKVSAKQRSEFEKLGAVNRTEEDLGRKRRTELNLREAAYVESRPDLAARFGCVCTSIADRGPAPNDE